MVFTDDMKTCSQLSGGGGGEIQNQVNVSEQETSIVIRQEMRHLCIRLCLYVLLAKGLMASAEHVTGSLNGRVILPCTYSGTTTTMCWGRGGCPSSKCNYEIIWTDGTKVTWRKSDRYQLLGDIARGNVSLTIFGVTEEDEGTYCCRVEIPGWSNDQKIEHIVKIYEAPSPPEPTDQSVHTIHVPAVSGDVTVVGSVKDILTLPCNYIIHKNQHPMCWRRGGCSASGCYDDIIETDGRRVTWRESDRYQLLGDIIQGNVSLTITGVTREDEGTYCCRVEIYELFYYVKKEIKIQILNSNHSKETLYVF
ncbi:junctional adhesion molecule-like [Rhinoderma darwinii]|uniref:junctional adhesion molecule-like n=1 Tax=Rhinoderma darwinii TaxID=43563 RepID=UPI003F6723F9